MTRYVDSSVVLRVLFDEPDRLADWADDQIHPNGPGHAVLALAFLRALGFEW